MYNTILLIILPAQQRIPKRTSQYIEHDHLDLDSSSLGGGYQAGDLAKRTDGPAQLPD